MDEIDEEFQSLMRRIRQGDQEAAWQMLELYGQHVLRVVRHNMHDKMRSKFDSIDFVQNVWASFFREPDTIKQFQQPQDLLAYLAKMARNKVYEETRRRFQYARYNIRSEERLDPVEHSKQAIDPQQHRPSEIAVVREQWNRVLSVQPPHYLQIVELRFQGASYQEIADSLKIDERTARRVVTQIVNEVGK